MSGELPHSRLGPLDDPVVAFIREAESYCAAIERAGQESSEAFARLMLERVTALYLAALGLPELGHDEPDVDEESYSSATADGHRLRLGTHLGEHDHYRLVFNPHEASGIVLGALSDDLADIYNDASKAIRMDRAHGASNLAGVCWQVRFDFREHWGLHAVHLMGALHWNL